MDGGGIAAGIVLIRRHRARCNLAGDTGPASTVDRRRATG